MKQSSATNSTHTQSFLSLQVWISRILWSSGFKPGAVWNRSVCLHSMCCCIRYKSMCRFVLVLRPSGDSTSPPCLNTLIWGFVLNGKNSIIPVFVHAAVHDSLEQLGPRHREEHSGSLFVRLFVCDVLCLKKGSHALFRAITSLCVGTRRQTHVSLVLVLDSTHDHDHQRSSLKSFSS